MYKCIKLNRICIIFKYKNICNMKGKLWDLILSTYLCMFYFKILKIIILINSYRFYIYH